MMQYLDITQWAVHMGYIGLFLVIFVETGLFIGFFLPGDSLVIAAGFLAAKGIFDIWTLISILVFAAILGYAVAYWFGKRLGNWLLGRRETLFFKHHYITDAKDFYQRYGGFALILGRLIPIVRTFVPIVAGMAEMPYKKYMMYNIIGGVLWGGVLTYIGYIIGRVMPDRQEYILPVVMIIVIVSVLPVMWHVWKNYRIKKQAKKARD